MGIFSSLHTGVSGLSSAQINISTTGHNITNINSSHYTRQRVVQSAAEAFHNTPGDIGLGARVDTIVRLHDEFAFRRLKSSSTAMENTQYKKQILEEVAQRFPDLQDVGIFQDIKNYFKAWNDLASHPYEGSKKVHLLESASTLASHLQDASSQLEKIRDNINEQLKFTVDEINKLGKDIAKINREINRVESVEPNRANDLRDKRDELELIMSKLVNITTFKRTLTTTHYKDAYFTDHGKDYNLNIDGFTIVEGPHFHPISLDNSDNKDKFHTIYFEMQDEKRVDMSPKITGGKLGAILDLRGRYLDNKDKTMKDGIITNFIDELNTFAKSLIINTNSVYASGAQERVASNPLHEVQDKTTLMSYDQNLKSGKFEVIVYDKQGNKMASKFININSSTTMNTPFDRDNAQGNSIVRDFNSSTDDNGDNNTSNDVDDYFTAHFSYNPNTKQGDFVISPKFANGEYTIAFNDNGTNFSGVFGLSKFFDGTNAKDIEVNSLLKQNPSLVKGHKSPILGNNEMANDMIQLQYNRISFFTKDGFESSHSIEEYYRFVTTDIAAKAQSANEMDATNQALHKSVNAQFQSISGVNLDEELANLIQFQTSYGAAAKIITTIEKMLETLLTVKQ